jgi:hypothetical protein
MSVFKNGTVYQIGLVHKKALTVGKSKTEAGTGRVVPLSETAIAALEVHGIPA